MGRYFIGKMILIKIPTEGTCVYQENLHPLYNEKFNPF